MEAYKEEIDQIIFRDEYVIIVTTKKTYTVKYKDMGSISKGWLDNIQACGLSIAKFPQNRERYLKGWQEEIIKKELGDHHSYIGTKYE